MQIIAVGLHKQNVKDSVWSQGGHEIEQFYDYIQSKIQTEPDAEFLFINSSHSREIIAVVDNIQENKEILQEFFLSFFKRKNSSKLIFHELEGPDAVKHFLQLSLGIELTVGTQQQEFLQRTSESIKTGNAFNLIGPVINRLYQSALLLKGQIKRNGVAVDQAQLGVQIQALIQKIFRKLSSPNLLVIGQNESTFPVIEKAFPKNLNNINFYSGESLGQQAEVKELENKIINCQIIFRLNQNYSGLFNKDSLTQIMKNRKNQPLLMVNLDSTISSESALNRIYNLYNYDISDFNNIAAQLHNSKNYLELIEQELKDFFSWFYSQNCFRFGNIISKSKEMESILEMIARISQTDITVLIQGESGTGKEIIAQAIHENSPRKDKPFIIVNCGALTETLLESELFGHEKGAFTGAIARKTGLFEEAHQGSIFLDEIGDTSQALQVKLLRVLQEGEIKRVGSSENIKIDVRLIAASNQNLNELVQQNKFRQDLFYRINVVNLEIPPLQNRKTDIYPLAEYFVGKYSDKMKKRIIGFTDRAKNILQIYNWPGNVRELENAIERAVALAIGNIIHTNDLPDNIRDGELIGVVKDKSQKQLTLKEIEEEVIQANLIANDWNYDKVAEILDIGRTTLWRKMKEYGIEKN
jgi:transcriptional regulator with PAS, ATPase and Fis domain